MGFNRLAREKSLYLRQHSTNPVDWYPWSKEAFETAKLLDKPIFLSIGYSSCHWCHVMEEESFNDEDVSALMNKVFVNIKVDREERPDIDSFYMKVCQFMTGSGGWPLTIIMTPDQKPFFAGTYFPKYSRYGRIGLIDLIKNIEKFWNERRQEIESATISLLAQLEGVEFSEEHYEIKANIIDETYNSLKFVFDAKNGGFGPTPKFPMPFYLNFLIDYFYLNQNDEALKILEKTLIKMRLGGIFDQVEFGFHRYSTDSEWLIPHFEKMLYDQALLLMVYSKAYLVT
ncbi:MAG: thioredoxin domain-containing protein [Candidatus Kapaibacteriales bacterium]